MEENFSREEDIPHPFASMKEYQIGRRIEKYRTQMNSAAWMGHEALAQKCQEQMNFALDDMREVMEEDGHVFEGPKSFDELPKKDRWMEFL
jgi:hypothetical protein